MWTKLNIMGWPIGAQVLVNTSSSNFDIELSSYFEKLILGTVLIVREIFMVMLLVLAFLGLLVYKYLLKCKTRSLTETDFILNQYEKQL